MVGEGAEELVSGALDPALKTIYNGKRMGENYSELEASDLLYGALLGAALGGVGGTAENARGGRGTQALETGEKAKSTSINTDPAGHTAIEQKIIDEYKKSVDDGLVAFVRRVRGLDNQKYRNSVRYPISEVGTRQAAEAKRITGIDATDFENIITGGAIDHIEHRHGIKGKADHSMADENDIARIQYVLKNFDTTEPLLNDNGTLSVSDVWKNSDGTPAPRILFTKKVDSTYYAAIAAPDSNARILAVESAFMSKKGGSTGTVLNMEKFSPQVTPQTPQRANASNIKLPRFTGGVKPEKTHIHADALRDLPQRNSQSPTPYTDAFRDLFEDFGKKGK